jgi:8-oxo-dGTP pyrophosphatase MutT (NUDIX family)
MYQLPSGHLEGKETMKDCIIRELKEELNIDILEKDINILHITHCITPERVYFNIYAEVLKYS